MSDPQNKPAGSAREQLEHDAAPQLMPAPPGYQFPTRKARREAELTGMIPIIVPKSAVPAVEPAPAAVPAPAVAPAPAAKQAGAALASAAEAAPAAAVAPARSGLSAQDPVPAAVVAAGTPAVKGAAAGSARTAQRPLADDGDLPAAEAPEEPAAGEPAPVSAMTAGGVPLVPELLSPVAGMPAEATAVKVTRTPKAGRDLPAAIGVGLALLLAVVGSLLFYPLAFLAVATVFACVGVWEVNRALVSKGIEAPLTPVMVGTLAMPASAYFAGAEGLLFALVASAAATVLWRSMDVSRGALKSIFAGVFSLMWIPFLLSFVFLMLRSSNGATTGLTLEVDNLGAGVLQVMIMLLLVVANDTCGYLVGVLFGKHAMAPKISPKKSWEGFAGSLAGATLVAIPATMLLLEQQWWVGLVLAVGLVCAATGGDFAESMIKRELGIKDMSNLLPGHGGIMDRLDSLVFAAPVAYAIFTAVGRV